MSSSVELSLHRCRLTFAFFLHVVLPVFIGAAMYTLWRSKALLVFTWYRWAGLFGLIEVMRQRVAHLRHLIPLSIMDSLPDALWVYSFTAALWLVWSKQPRSGESLLWVFLPVSMAVGAEFGQFLKFVPGTFDWFDLLAYILAFAAALTLPRILIKNN